MPSVLAYYRPESLDEAATLLGEPNRSAIGGGTVVVPDSRTVRDQGVELVDLQALGLDGIELQGDTLSIGSMVRLGDLMTDQRVPALLRELAGRELPSALRNQATVGGTVALADADSVLLAGLLVHDAQVYIHGAQPRALSGWLEQQAPGIITSVSVNVAGSGAVAATGRTPGDVPIVAAVTLARGAEVTLALTGVATTPVLADPADPAAGLLPPGDFRGTSDYRKHLATTLARRAVSEVAS